MMVREISSLQMRCRDYRTFAATTIKIFKISVTLSFSIV